MKQNETKKVPKSSEIYKCNSCDYVTSRKSQYERHLTTDKHKNGTFETNETKKVPKSSIKLQCYCNLHFNSRTTLWRHKKICSTINDNTIIINDKLTNDKLTNDKLTNDKLTDNNLILMLINECKDIRNENKELIKIIKNGTYNINSNNKTFNLNFFLNETCKDAMNITDFVNSIKIQLSDLENVGKIGYVEGISNIINNNLKALDVTQRPIHCTDKKREVLYIKDENKWEKENENKTIIRKAIKEISHKNSKMIQLFKEAHPDCGKSISKYSDQYNKIIIESMGGQGDNDIEKENKIIRNISKEIIINK
jgi:hypothetical protein